MEVSEDSLSLLELMMVRVERKEISIRGGHDAFLNIKKKQEIEPNGTSKTIEQMSSIGSAQSKVEHPKYSRICE